MFVSTGVFPIYSKEFPKDKFVQSKLTVKLHAGGEIPFEICAHHYFIRRAQLMFHPSVENNWIQIIPIKLIFHHRLEYTQIKVFADVGAQSIKRKPFLWIASIRWSSLTIKEDVGCLLCPNIGQLEPPDFGIDLDKCIRVREIR